MLASPTRKTENSNVLTQAKPMRQKDGDLRDENMKGPRRDVGQMPEWRWPKSQSGSIQRKH
eukprot:1676639-Amphidinium_carterae.1